MLVTLNSKAVARYSKVVAQAVFGRIPAIADASGEGEEGEKLEGGVKAYRFGGLGGVEWRGLVGGAGMRRQWRAAAAALC